MSDTEKTKAVIHVTVAVADAIRSLGEVPSGLLYARLMDRMSLDVYTKVIGILKRSKFVRESNNVLYWEGPR